MADLFALLSWSSSSLSAHRASSATASHNLSNANTPGFARQRAHLEAALPADAVGARAYVGRGAALSGVSQARDAFVERQLPAAFAAASYSDARANGLSGLTALDPDGGAGLTNALDAFYGALRQLTQTPGDRGARQAVLAQGRVVALAFNRAAQNVAGARDGLDAQVARDVARVNDLAKSLAALNRQVRVEQASGAVPNDLLDARLRVQDELVQLTGASVVPDADGNVNLQLPAGGALVNGDAAATLSTQKDAANRGHLAVFLTPPGSSAAAALGPGALGGALGGALDARDGALATAERDIDTLAYDFASAVNAAHRNGVGLDGVGGRDFFAVAASAVGAARTLAVDPGLLANPDQLGAAASAAGVPGDASNLFAIIQTESAALSGGLDVFDTLAAAIASWGSAVDSARTAQGRDGAVRDQLTALREATAGVSIDEEMIALTTSQRAYEAVLKVIQTTDEMLDSLMKLR
ncbi:MAG: flagellar hook-associated protein FlgK [Myxococcota bacterium]